MNKRIVRGTGRRSLSESEKQLWEEMTRDVRRSKKRIFHATSGRADLREATGLHETATTTVVQPLGAVPVMAPVTSTKPKSNSDSNKRGLKETGPKPPPLSSIDYKTQRQIKRGGVEIDARIDLHGLYQEAAHRRLIQFVLDASASGARVVLVITGKGRTPADQGAGLHGDAGILRRLTPLWLGEPALRPFVIGFGVAARHHGGDGALYVRIRQKQRLRTGGGLT